MTHDCDNCDTEDTCEVKWAVDAARELAALNPGPANTKLAVSSWLNAYMGDVNAVAAFVTTLVEEFQIDERYPEIASVAEVCRKAAVSSGVPSQMETLLRCVFFDLVESSSSYIGGMLFDLAASLSVQPPREVIIKLEPPPPEATKDQPSIEPLSKTLH